VVHKTRPTILAPLALAACTLLPAAPAAGDDAPVAAQAPAGAARIVSQADLFAHNVMIAKPDVALAAARALLDESVGARELASAIDSGDLGARLEAAFRRSRAMADVSDAAASLETKLETGRRELARELSRIEEAVGMLVGPMRGQELAKSRLMAAGDRAVPSLLRHVAEGRDLGMDAACTRMLIELKSQAALPLAQALADLDPGAQRKVCAILGQLGSPVAVPFLLDVAQAEGATTDVSGAALDAVRALGAADGPAHAAYAAGALRFLSADPSLAAHPSEPVQMTWRWTEFGGLAGAPISTTVFYDSMAMLLARRALELDPADAKALAAFVAADLRREQRSGDGTEDPLFGGQDRSAAFFAAVSGPSVLQDVVQVGLDLRDPVIVRAGLQALRRSAGLGGLVEDGSSPAIRALDHDDRALRLDAALALASVEPTSAYPGSEQVVPILAQAVRGGGASAAGIVTSGVEAGQRVSAMAQAAGYEPMTAVGNAAEYGALASRNGGCDVVVIAGEGGWARAELESIRSGAGGASVPAVLVVPADDVDSLLSLASGGRVAVLSSEVSDEGFRAGIASSGAVAATGAVSEGQFSAALDALERIGVSGGSVYRLADAESILVGAMRSQEGRIMAQIASILAWIDSERAQQAVIEAALAASGEGQSDLLGSVAEGARRFGGKATKAQTDAIRELVRTSNGPTADAAAAAFGALGLPAGDAVELVLKFRVPGATGAPSPAAGSEAAEPAEGEEPAAEPESGSGMDGGESAGG
jgi:hypothetical protein